MKILLINPTRLGESGKPMRYRFAFRLPLQLAILDSLTPKSHQVKIMSDVAEEIDFSGGYDLVGITAMSAQIQRAYQIADRFRAMGTKVVMGGIHPSTLPEECLGHADAVVVGEAENIWPQLVSDCEKNALKQIYRDSSYPDLTELIIPKWDNITRKVYFPQAPVPLFSTRGCPYNCKFCSVTKYMGRRYRVKPVANVVKEIEALPAKTYFFCDDNIVGNPDYSRELFRVLAAKKVRWSSNMSTTVLNHPDLIELAAKSGCYKVFMGIESISPKALSSMNKGFNKVEEYAELFRRFRKAGIILMAGIIFGFDEDTPEIFRETTDFLMKNKTVSASFSLLTPLPGTTLFDEMAQSGRLLHTDWSLYDVAHVVMRPNHFTPEELYEIFWKTCQNFQSYPKIARRLLYKLTGYRHPLRYFVEEAFMQYFQRKYSYGRGGEI